jgi:hypothetical protein
VVAAIGAAPDVAFGFFLQLGVQQHWWSLSVEGRGDLPATEPTTGTRFSTSLLFASLVPCMHLSIFAACGLLAAGAQLGADTDGAVTRHVSAPYYAAGGRLALEIDWEVPRSQLLALQVRGDLLASLYRAALEVGGSTLGHTPALTGAIGLALLLHFP